MGVNVSGRKMNLTEALRAYAEEKIGASLKVMDIKPLEAEVVLYREKNPSNPRQAVCEVTLRARNHVIRVEECEEDMYAAIDVAAAKVVRQLRKFKTRVVDKHVETLERGAQEGRAAAAELDVAGLMAELAGDEDEIVRVKVIPFEALTREEALIKIDLLGHDFFAYADRDTGVACVLYRRNGGGYGLIMQKE